MRGIFIAVFSFLFAGVLVGQSNVEETREAIRKWVETRQLIGKERSDWATQREVLQDIRALLEQQQKELQAKLEEVEGSTSDIDRDVLKLQEEREAYIEAGEQVGQVLTALERRLQELVRFFPPSLKSTLNQPLARIPADEARAASMSSGERMLNILTIIGQAERFNNTVTLTGETRSFAGGEERQVTTLYWGLSMAMYVDRSGQYGGLGYPAADEWEWTERHDLARDIARLVAIYEGSGDPSFIEIPLEIK